MSESDDPAGGKKSSGDVRRQRLLHLGNEVDTPALEGRLVLIRLPVVRSELLLRDCQGSVDRGEHRLAGVLRKARPFSQRLHVEHFEELELEVATADDPGTHGASIATPPLLPSRAASASGT